MNIKDVELTVPAGKGYYHTKTKRPERLTDGRRHPIRIVKPGQERKGR